jgi:hypothetical protein
MINLKSLLVLTYAKLHNLWERDREKNCNSPQIRRANKIIGTIIILCSKPKAFDANVIHE